RDRRRRPPRSVRSASRSRQIRWYGCEGRSEGNQPQIFQSSPDLVGALVRIFAIRMQHDLGIRGRLVRIGNTGELADLAGLGFLVESLDVTARDHFERALDVDLDKILDTRPQLVTDRAIG